MEAFKVFIIAGEESGDILGAKLMKALKSTGYDFLFKGLGGQQMKNEGLTSYFDISELSVMGFTEVIPKLPKILKIKRELVNEAKKFIPDIIITIDSFSFTHRLAKRLRKVLDINTPFIHLVAPTVWAYKESRAEILKSLYDHVLLLFPFEKPYFDKVGLASTFIGHPIVEDAHKNIVSLKKREKVIVLMPGSRKQEIKYHAQLFKEVIEIANLNDYKFFIPTFKRLENEVREIFDNKNKFIISTDPTIKEKYFSIAHAALIKSGTSSLEMMLYNIPCLVAYKMSTLTYLWIKIQIKVKFATICNLVLNRKIIPELIQFKCTAQNIALELNNIISNKDKRNEMENAYKDVLTQLGINEVKTPSQKAAEVIMKYLENNQ